MACKEKEIQSLQERVIELERQLAEAQAAIQALTPLHRDTRQTAVARQLESQGQPAIDPKNIMIGEAGIRRGLYVMPYPLMIRREDGHVVMINAAWTKITGYTLEEIPTIDEWTRKAYGESAPQRKSEILNESFSQTDIKQWGEYEIITRSGEKRIWDFSTAALGVDEQGRRLVMAMAVDTTERRQAEEKLRAARDEATWLARFPSENPNPVIRVSDAGILLYCNPPAASMRGWRCAVDAALSRPLLDLVELAVEQNRAVEQDVLLGEKFYSVSVIPILEHGYLNLYGKDITERKQAEKALAESERRQREITRLLELDQARLAAVLQNMPVGVWIADQTGRLIGSNQQADRIWAGESPLLNSIAEYSKYESWYPENGKLLQPEEYPLALALGTGQPVEPVELKIRRFDGSEGTVLASAAPIHDNQGQLMGGVGVNVDITEGKQAEARLRESEAKYRSLVETAFEGVWVVDTTGRTTFVNHRMAQMLKYDSPDELINHSAFDFVPPQDLEENQAKFRTRLSTNNPEQYDVRLRCRDGSIIWASAASNNVLDENGNITGRLALFIDITERKHAEERFNKAFHASPNALVISHQKDGRIETINNTFVSFFGYSREETIGKTSVELGMFVSPLDRQKAVQRLQQDGSVRDYELDVRLKSGEVRNASLSVEKIEIGGKHMMLTTIQDITLRRQAEARINDLLALNDKILNHSAVGILTYKVSGQCVFANEKVASIVGTTVAHLLTQNFHTIAAWKRSGLYALVQQAISTQAPATADIHHLSTFGKDAWITVHCITFKSKGEDHVLLSISDITERKKAEEALRESEERFAKAFHASPDAIIISRLSDGLIMEVNEGWSTIFGHSQSEAFGRTTLELGIYVNSNDREQAIDRLKKKGGLRDFEVQIRRKSGEVRQASLSAERIEINGVECLLAIVQDITERKQAEQALRESEHRLNRAQEIAHLGSWELDLVKDRLTWSDEVYRIFGLQPQEFGATYEAFLEAVHPEDRAAVDNAYSSSIREGRDRYEIEHRVVQHSSGKVRIVHEKCEHFRDQSDQIIRSTGMVHDITERKQAEEALQESERRFRSLANSMPQLVWTALPDGTVDYYNQRYQEYQEIKQIEVAAWEWAPVLHPDDLLPTVDAWQRSLETGDIYQIEHRVRLADGSYRWHLSRGVPMRDESGRIIRWFGTATDIHDLKLAEEQLKDYTKRLEHSNRELEQFAFIASHDLQEPLRKIEMFGDMLLERATFLNDQERNYIDRMRHASGRMRGMVEGLLQLSRVTTQGKPFVSVDLSQVTSEVLHDLESQIRRVNGKVDVETLPTVEGDALQLRQLMQNLIGNALKYYQPGTPPEVSVYAKQLLGRVQIIVQDQGIGFAQEDAKRVFQPFQRLIGRSQYEGSGMGLAICRRIVERHGGEITARSQPGRGATFIVTLPSHPSESTKM